MLPAFKRNSCKAAESMLLPLRLLIIMQVHQAQDCLLEQGLLHQLLLVPFSSQACHQAPQPAQPQQQRLLRLP